MKSPGRYQESRLRSGAPRSGHINKPSDGPVRTSIETRRLILRPFESGDVEVAFAWFGDPSVMRFTPTGPDASGIAHVAASETNNLREITERRELLYQRNNRFSNFSSKTRSFNPNFVNSTPIPSPRAIFRTMPSACTFPPGTSNESLSFVPTGGGLGMEMNSPPLPSVLTRENSCRSPPCHATRMPFGNEMRAYLRFLRMASSVMWCIPPNVTEVLARFAKIFDPAQQRCIGARINVQKFEAHAHP